MFVACRNVRPLTFILRNPYVRPSGRFVIFKLSHCWVPACLKQSGACRRLASGYAGFCVMGESPVFRIYSQLFCHTVAVNCAHALPLYCVRCYALPDPCASIAATATSPRHLRTVLQPFIQQQFIHCTYSRLPT